jgi:uncharacterized protein YecT (DUF1311 family)
MMKYIYHIAIAWLIVFSVPCKAQNSIRGSDGKMMITAMNLDRDLKNICESAISYRKKTTQSGSDQASYIGYTVPKNLMSTDAGSYSTYEVYPDTLVICVNNIAARPARLIIIDSNGKIKSQLNAYDYEMDKIGKLAYQYFMRPVSEGGGQGSYIGFTIPRDNEWTIFAHYTITDLKPKEITLQAYIPLTRLTYKAIFNAHGMRYEGGDVIHFLPAIQLLSHAYRWKPVSLGGGGGSYLGLTLPKEYDSTDYGHYALKDVQPNQFTIVATPRNSWNSLLFIVDSSGSYRPAHSPIPANIDSSFAKNYAGISIDIKNIGKAAAGYWRKTRPSNDMPGSFEGFTIPDSLVTTTTGTYTLTDIHDDMLHVSIKPKDGSRTQYYSIDRYGIERYLNPNSYTPTAVMPNRDEAFLKYKTTDAKLNDTYQKLLDKKKSDAQFLKNLRNSERLWIKFRDAQLVEKYNQNVSIEDIRKLTTSQIVFLTILEEKRLKELQDLMEQ